MCVLSNAYSATVFRQQLLSCKIPLAEKYGMILGMKSLFWWATHALCTCIEQYIVTDGQFDTNATLVYMNIIMHCDGPHVLYSFGTHKYIMIQNCIITSKCAKSPYSKIVSDRNLEIIENSLYYPVLAQLVLKLWVPQHILEAHYKVQFFVCMILNSIM